MKVVVEYHNGDELAADRLWRQLVHALNELDPPIYVEKREVEAPKERDNRGGFLI